MTTPIPALDEVARVLDALLPTRSGKLDRTLELTTDSGPTDLGFLDLTLELTGPDRLVRPIRALLDVCWTFTDRAVVIHTAGRVMNGDTPPGWHVVAMDGSLEAANLSTGLVTVGVWSVGSATVRRKRRAGTVDRPALVTLRLARVRTARPIGNLPIPQNGTFMPFRG